MPGGGWPVAIYAHGNNDIKDDSYLIAETLAERIAHGAIPLEEAMSIAR